MLIVPGTSRIPEVPFTMNWHVPSATLKLTVSNAGATVSVLNPQMPPDLVKAHTHLDALVDKAYGLKPSCTDSDRVAHLFKLYAEKTAPSPCP